MKWRNINARLHALRSFDPLNVLKHIAISLECIEMLMVTAKQRQFLSRLDMVKLDKLWLSRTWSVKPR